MKWQGWIVTSDWYDEMGSGEFCGMVWRTRTEAIREFLNNLPGSTWRGLKRHGWRCVKCTVNW
jgi:hypothetical protein